MIQRIADQAREGLIWLAGKIILRFKSRAAWRLLVWLHNGRSTAQIARMEAGWRERL